MEHQIKEILDNLHDELDSYQQNMSLVSGVAGISLFKFTYYKYFREGTFDLAYNDRLNNLIESSANIDYPAFAGGKSGINWFFSFLYSQGVLDANDWKLITGDNQTLAIAAINFLQNDYYDPLHGGIGIARQLLYLKNNISVSFFSRVFETLNHILSKGGDMFRHFNTDNGVLELNKTNLGLSHGITGILKFCIDCYNKGVCKQQSQTFALNIIDYLIGNTLSDRTKSYFASINDSKSPSQQASRLGWCYGDLGIAYILFKAGTTFNDENVKNFALDVLYHSTERRQYEQTQVTDAGICHGSSGIAHIYNRLWDKTKDAVFAEACRYWIKRTIEYSMYPDGIAGFKAYSNVRYMYENNVGLLEGATGVGLVLLSYLTKNFDWDYCIMLND